MSTGVTKKTSVKEFSKYLMLLFHIGYDLNLLPTENHCYSVTASEAQSVLFLGLSHFEEDNLFPFLEHYIRKDHCKQ